MRSCGITCVYVYSMCVYVCTLCVVFVKIFYGPGEETGFQCIRVQFSCLVRPAVPLLRFYWPFTLSGNYNCTPTFLFQTCLFGSCVYVCLWEPDFGVAILMRVYGADIDVELVLVWSRYWVQLRCLNTDIFYLFGGQGSGDHQED